MNLVMLDIDGTLTLSYEYDRVVFSLALGEVLGTGPVDTDLNGYINKTSTGVTEQAIRQVTGKVPRKKQIEAVKRNVLGRLARIHHDSPRLFQEVPGAHQFVEKLRSQSGTGVAIATGCWLDEAIFKLTASGLDVTGIPLATSDNERIRARIMQTAAQKAREFYGCARFERIVYVGDGPWDLKEARALGYGFIGIGPRISPLKGEHGYPWHTDFKETEAVLASVESALRS
jgi:phosphoglycolate phosphatase-like HAD superfamily hydrolase